MPSIDHMTRTEIRKLARRGKLIDETFKKFQRAVYPGAPPHQVQVMRVAFFAGAAELYTLISSGLDDGVSETEGDLALMQQWVDELERFCANTIAALSAHGPKQ